MTTFKTDADGIEQEVSRETKVGDFEGFAHTCHTCGREAVLVPLDWDTDDWAKVVCPACFEGDWIRVY